MTRRLMLICEALAGVCMLAFVAVVSVEAKDPSSQIRYLNQKQSTQVTKEMVAIVRLTYEGQVVDTSNKPMQGVTVKAQGKATYTATTDNKGVFTFTNMIPGEYRIIVEKAVLCKNQSADVQQVHIGRDSEIGSRNCCCTA